MTDDEVVCELAVPGVKQENLSISVTGTPDLRVRSSATGNETKDRRLPGDLAGDIPTLFRLPIQVDADNATASVQDGY